MADAAPVPITPPYVPIIDPTTGQMHRAWYMFFLSLFRGVQGADDWNKSIAVSDSSAQINAAIQTAQLSAQLGATQADVAALQSAVQGLALAPPPRAFKRARYGSFYDTTTQTATTINTAKAITFNTTDLSQGVYIGSPTSRIYVDTEGVYDFQTSLQLDSTVATDERFYLWIAKNGVDVPASASTVRLKGNDAEVILSLNYFLALKAGDYVELLFSTTDLGVQILYAAAAPPVPAIPSIILTVNNGIQGVQ